MHKAEIDVARLLIFLPNIALEDTQEILIAGAVRLRGQVRRLDDHEQMVVPVKHGDGESSRLHDLRHANTSRTFFFIIARRAGVVKRAKVAAH